MDSVDSRKTHTARIQIDSHRKSRTYDPPHTPIDIDPKLNPTHTSNRNQLPSSVDSRRVSQQGSRQSPVTNKKTECFPGNNLAVYFPEKYMWPAIA